MFFSIIWLKIYSSAITDSYSQAVPFLIKAAFQPFGGGHGTPHFSSWLLFHPPFGDMQAMISDSETAAVIVSLIPDLFFFGGCFNFFEAGRSALERYSKNSSIRANSFGPVIVWKSIPPNFLSAFSVKLSATHRAAQYSFIPASSGKALSAFK
jgi:hypothetical protein